MTNPGTVESFSTEAVAPGRRKAFWNDVVCRSFTELDSQPQYAAEFNGRLQRIQLGSMSLAQVVSAPAIVSHTSASARRVFEPVFLIHLQARGASINSQDGREAVLGEGDFTLCDSTRPYRVQFWAPNDMLVFRIPSAAVRDRLVQPAAFTAQCIPGDRGAGNLASLMLRRLWQLCLGGLDLPVARRLCDNLLDLIVTALCAEQPGLAADGSRLNTRRLHARQYIEENLTRPDLSADTIATAMTITTRYVHRLFEGADETLGQYIQRRRLEESARRLTDPAQAGRSVTQIAFDCAFNDTSHFGRCFKKQYGMTPLEYRKLRK